MRSRRLMQLFLSYADLPSLEVVKCDEVALDLVENTWTSRSGIECRLVIQLTRDSRVYIARGVRDTLLAVISTADAIHAHNRLHAAVARKQGDVTQCVYSRWLSEIHRERAQVSLIRECASDRIAAIRRARELKVPPLMRKSDACIGALLAASTRRERCSISPIPTRVTYLRKDKGRAR